MKDKFEDLSFEREITRTVYLHERFLSFVNDFDAECFDEWWHGEGSESFQAYMDIKD